MLLKICPSLSTLRFQAVNGTAQVSICSQVLLGFAIFDICGEENSRNWTLFLSPFRCVRIVVLLQTYESIRRVSFSAVLSVISCMHHVGLFVVVYFGFLCIASTVFAGCVTEVLEDGGPGDWSTSPWNSTDFGSAAYYPDLNFGM